MRTVLSITLGCALTLATPSFGQVTIAPLATFGGGDGWISATESESDFLTQGNFERGLGYNPVEDNLYYVSRAAGALNVRILDALTGLDEGALDTTGIEGGIFALNKILVGDDGLIYGANLRTGTGTGGFKLYRWDSESSSPVTIFDALPDTAPRVGDDLDIIGGGDATRLVAGYGVSATAAFSNGYIVIDPTASALNPTAPVFTNVGFPEIPAAGGTIDGDFRQGIAFISGGSSGTVLGSQGTTRLTDYADDEGTWRANLSLQVPSERILDYATIGGLPILATMEVGGTPAAPLLTAGTVRLYDMTDPASPSFLTSLRNMTGAPFENPNFAGDLRWGKIAGNTATLYALNTNNGIQAFSVTVPEPSMACMLGVGVVSLLSGRRRRPLHG